MNLFIPFLKGSFFIKKEKHPKLKLTDLKLAVFDFIEKQMPSKMAKQDHRVYFRNMPFRIRVRRGANYLRAFNKGNVVISNDGEQFKIEYEGHLLRGLFITAIYSLITIALCISNWANLFWIPAVVVVISYFFQIVLTQIVFPSMLFNAIKARLKELQENENS